MHYLLLLPHSHYSWFLVKDHIPNGDLRPMRPWFQEPSPLDVLLRDPHTSVTTLWRGHEFLHTETTVAGGLAGTWPHNPNQSPSEIFTQTPSFSSHVCCPWTTGTVCRERGELCVRFGAKCVPAFVACFNIFYKPSLRTFLEVYLFFVFVWSCRDGR